MSVASGGAQRTDGAPYATRPKGKDTAGSPARQLPSLVVDVEPESGSFLLEPDAAIEVVCTVVRVSLVC